MKQNKLATVIFALTIVAFILVSALIVWVIWNGVLVTAISTIKPVSFLWSLGFMAGIYSGIAIFLASKQLVEFLLLRVSLSYARKRMKKEVDAQAELLKHFRMFDKKE